MTILRRKCYDPVTSPILYLLFSILHPRLWLCRVAITFFDAPSLVTFLRRHFIRKLVPLYKIWKLLPVSRLQSAESSRQNGTSCPLT
jgi:hypothetical protein